MIPSVPLVDLSNPELVLDASEGAAARLILEEGSGVALPLPELALLPPPVADSIPPSEPTGTRTGALVRTTSGTYRVLRRLAAGGQGEVFLARKLGPDGSWAKDVALKRVVPYLRDHPAEHRSLFEEARLAALLTHRNIASVFDFVELDQGGFLLVMEYLPGLSLRAVLQLAREKGRHLSESFALYVTAEVAEALAYAHAATHDGLPLGIVHRDVSPHNILVTDSGGVKLLDFGVALSRLEDRDATQNGAVKGKASYMSPEQAAGGALDGRSDQFALAAVAFELLTGKRLYFGQAEMDTLSLVASATPEHLAERLRDVPEQFRPLLSRALSLAPGDRYPTCLDFAEALRDVLHGMGRYGPAQAQEELEGLKAMSEPPPTVNQALTPRSSFEAKLTRKLDNVTRALYGVAVGLALLAVVLISCFRPPQNGSVRFDVGFWVHAPDRHDEPQMGEKAVDEPIPKEPRSPQKRPPCDRDVGEDAINGACYQRTDIKPPCGPKLFRSGDTCYRVIFAEPQPQPPLGVQRP